MQTVRIRTNWYKFVKRSLQLLKLKIKVASFTFSNRVLRKHGWSWMYPSPMPSAMSVSPDTVCVAFYGCYANSRPVPTAITADTGDIWNIAEVYRDHIANIEACAIYHLHCSAGFSWPSHPGAIPASNFLTVLNRLSTLEKLRKLMRKASSSGYWLH